MEAIPSYDRLASLAHRERELRREGQESLPAYVKRVLSHYTHPCIATTSTPQSLAASHATAKPMSFSPTALLQTILYNMCLIQHVQITQVGRCHNNKLCRTMILVQNVKCPAYTCIPTWSIPTWSRRLLQAWQAMGLLPR